MTSRRTRFLRLMAAAALTLGLVACGGQDEPETKTAAETSAPAMVCAATHFGPFFSFQEIGLGTIAGAGVMRGTRITTRCCTVSRASTSPLPPLSFGAPRPLIRKSFPCSEPAGIFSETAPSGVGTSTSVPSAASASDTGTSTTRSAPRRW